MWGQDSGNWSDHKATSFNGGNGTVADPYIIHTAEQLAYFASQAANTSYYALDADIDLSGHYWIPAINGTCNFDGRGRVISNMHVDSGINAVSGTACYGFFARVSTGTVKNIVFNSALIEKAKGAEAPSTDVCMGIVAGEINGNGQTYGQTYNIVIRSSQIKDNKCTSSYGNHILRVGGAVGYIENGKIYNVVAGVDIDMLTSSETPPNNAGTINIAGVVGGVSNAVYQNLWAQGTINTSIGYSTGIIRTLKSKVVFGAVVGGGAQNIASYNLWYVNGGNTLTSNTAQGSNNYYTSKSVSEQSLKDFSSNANIYINTIPENYYFAFDENTSSLKMINNSYILDPSHPNKAEKKHTFTLTFGSKRNTYSYVWTIDGVKVSGNRNDNVGSISVETGLTAKRGQIIVKDGDNPIETIDFEISPETWEHLASDAFGGGDGTQVSPYLIANETQLALLAKNVNAGTTYSGKYFKVTTGTLDLSAAWWMPIGNSTNSFQGVFDGNGATISNMQVAVGGSGSYGLFGTIGGANKANAVVKNLIVSTPAFEANENVSNHINIGVVVGDAQNNSEVSNIIVRSANVNPSLTLSENQFGYNVNIGGVVGTTSSDGSNNYILRNISSSAIVGEVTNAQNNVTVNRGSVFGRLSSAGGYPKYLYQEGSSYYGGTSGISYDQATWASSGESDFVANVNTYIGTANDETLLNWKYADNEFSFIGFSTLSLVQTAVNTITASAIGESASTTYKWYTSDDNITFTELAGETSKTLSIDHSPEQVHYVKVETKDPETVSHAIEVPVLTATAKMTTSGSTGTIAVTNNLWADNANLDIAYQWCRKVTTTTGTGDDAVEEVSYEPISGETAYNSSNTSAVACTVEVRANGVLILRQTLSKPTVIYLHPSSDRIQGYAQGNDANDGFTPGKAVKTWKKAYEKLPADGSVETNIIVLMGTHEHKDPGLLSGTIDYGLAPENSLRSQGGTTGDLATWNGNVPAAFKKAATITGKYNNIDYQGEYVIDGGKRGTTIFDFWKTSGGRYIGIFADTKFEYLTFTQNAYKGRNRGFCAIFAQYHNLTMGDGLKMKYFEQSEAYGKIGNSVTPTFQIFGGFNNDARFVNNIGAMDNDEYFPKKGFTIDIRSGYYSIICAGGRQSSPETNGVYGTPNHPVKCTINIDINREHNDKEENKENTVSTYDAGFLGIFGDTLRFKKPDYDISLILAGTHEGAMYGDVDIVVKSGNVARIANGTLGARTAIDNFPFNTYMGRASILLDPAKSEMNAAPINSRVLVTEIYGGSVGRANGDDGMIDVPFLGESYITINGGTIGLLKESIDNGSILCGLYGAGMGGVNGIGTSDSHGYTTGTGRNKEYPYWNGGTVVYGDATTYFNNLSNRVFVTPHNAIGSALAPIDLQYAKSVITINDGVFGTSTKPIDGIFGGGSGFTSKEFLEQNGGSSPNTKSGNLYGNVQVNINGGSFYCDIYGAGRGTDKYDGNWVVRNSTKLNEVNYKGLGQVYGNVEVNINGGTINGSVFGAGAGVLTLNDMAKVKGKTTVNISNNAQITGDVYGGADMAIVDNGTANATNVAIGGTASVGGSVFAAGNGRINNNNVGKVTGITNLSIQDSPIIGGDIYGGGAYGDVEGSTNVTINDTPTIHNVFGGGSGDAGTNTSADISGNTTVIVNGGKYADGSLYYIYGGGNVRSVVDGNTNVTVSSLLSKNAQATVYGGGFGANTSCANSFVTINPSSQPETVDGALVGLGAVFGGGKSGVVKNKATVLLNGGTILRDVFGGGNEATVGTKPSSVTDKWYETNGTKITMTGENCKVYGDVYGGGYQVPVIGDAVVQLTKGSFGGNVFGGGNGVLNADNTASKYADITHNTTVYVEGASVIWNEKWDNEAQKLYKWDGIWGSENSGLFLTGSQSDPIFLTNHNIYGGGNNACAIGSSDDASSGTSTVTVTDGFVGYDLLSTDIWKNAFNDSKNPHFYVFGGGFGAYTNVKNTVVNVGVEGTLEEDATTDDQLAKPAGITLNAKKMANRRNISSGEGTDNADIGVYDNSYGIPNYTVLGVVGGGYAGLVSENTDVTVSGNTFIHRVFGGGYGLLSAYEALNTNPAVSATDSRKLRDVLGEVGQNTNVKADGAFIYGDIFGGGAGVESATITSGLTDFPDMGRVRGTTSVTVSDIAKVYGSVYGGGDVANVGGNAISADANRSSVDIIGGDIFGQVFGGGNGRRKAEAADYTVLGRIEGNTLVHVADTEPEVSLGSGEADGTIVPYIWNCIYGGGSYGTVNGNTKVWIEGGMLGYNIFGGGFGDAADDTPESQANGTYANVNGSTNVTIDGGNWIWNRKADTQGNITIWTNASLRIANSMDELKTMSLSERLALVNQHADPEFFDKTHNYFAINHNIYGGGNAACYVAGNADVTINHSPLGIIKDSEGNSINMLDASTVAGLCWYAAINNTAHPQFSVFGGGYGMNTKVANTNVYAGPGPRFNASGTGVLGEAAGGKATYAYQEADVDAYNAFEKGIYDSFQSVPGSVKMEIFGSADGSNNDVRTFLRYRASQLAYSLGTPSFTFMNIHGGGFAGYVTGNTNVVTDCQLACRNVFGGGLGALPDTNIPLGTETYGQVGGNTKVTLLSGTVSLNVFGGGAGVESYENGGSYIDFPEMARVNGKTEVEVYGEPMSREVANAGGEGSVSYNVERVLVFGSVYGGGDVANVGPESKRTTSAAQLNSSSTDFTTSVSIYGASILSQVYAGGNGRTIDKCNDYKALGGVYGNTRLYVENTDNAYPYIGSQLSTAVIPYLWNRAYGGGQNGTVFGNTLVDIAGGYFADDIFGGGWGNFNESEGVSEDKRITSADVTGNTNIIIRGGEAKLTSMWLAGKRTWAPANIDPAKGILYSPQYDFTLKKFVVDHNIYGGGNVACEVGGSTYVTMSKGMLHDNQEVVSAVNSGGLFNTNEWREVYNKVGSPHFCVYGGGYGKNTLILGNTNVNVAFEAQNGKTIASAGDLDDIANLYKHFVSGQAVMDIVGGGFSGSVKGSTNVTVGGETFCRRIFGGGFYAPVGSANIQINSVDCNDVFGGGLMGNIGFASTDVNYDGSLVRKGEVTLNVGGASSDNSNIWIHQNVYGGNDASGDILQKTTLNFYGGHILGNVYGAGNGNYLYAVGRNREQEVTPVEYYRTEKNTYDLVYAVPSRNFMTSVAASTPAQRMVNCASYRPKVQDVEINMKGKSGDLLQIAGSVFGGGNSATVNTLNKDASGNDIQPKVTFNFGSYIDLGSVFMGCDGDAMFDDVKQFRKSFEDVNFLNLEDDINWATDPGNHGITTTYLPVSHENRPIVYKHLLDLYFQPVEMNIQPEIFWGDDFSNTDNETVGNVTIGSFICGGNRGNMNVETDAEGKIFTYGFPQGVIIKDKIVGGCSNANYQMPSSQTKHEGGYLLGERGKKAINLNIECDFAPHVGANEVMEGANVYGGCYTSGIVRGDVYINMKSDMLKNISPAQLAATNAKDIAVSSVYGAGFGSDSHVFGNTHIDFGKGVSKTANAGNGATANFIFGGGQQGNLVGNSNVRIYNGHIASSVCGGSYAGFMWGSSHLLIGYPKYYTVQKSGIYKMQRTDKWNENNGAIKKQIYLLAGDIIANDVYDAIVAYNGADKLSAEQLTAAFGSQIVSAPSDGLSWNDIDIRIDEAVYGGGYSLASGSSVAAGTYTVKKYDADENIDDDFTDSELTDLDNGENGTKGFGGNTTVIIWDAPTNDTGISTDHVAVSSQTMKSVNLTGMTPNTDLCGYYYMNTDGNYQYINKAGVYSNSNYQEKIKDIHSSDRNIYQYDGEGGLFGDGHLSFAEGFRSADICGYGFAACSSQKAKIINTFQRMDMIRLTDCAVVLLGARDYTVNEISTTPYSIARVGEIQMYAQNVTNLQSGTLAVKSASRSRNYLGLSNNIHYCGAVYSNTAFATDDYRKADGSIEAAGTSYRAKKQDYITNHKSDAVEFRKRNDGTAANMIGIASGYALKIQDVIPGTSSEQASLYYGPIVGVVEMNLINVEEGEGGGYVYADNIHHREGTNVPASHVDSEDFLETSGNFVFPYNAYDNRWIEDDCYPGGYDANNNAGIPTRDAHYWYVTGWDYNYNMNITGYTYDSSDPENTRIFNSDNSDMLIQLVGASTGQNINLRSITWSGSNDLTTQKDNGSHDEGWGNKPTEVDGEHYTYNHYNLNMSVSATDKDYSDGENSSFWKNLPLTANLPTSPSRSLTNALSESEPSIYFQLTDQVDNSGEEYYDNYLADPCIATVVLTAQAKDEGGNAITDYMLIKEFYTLNDGNYEAVTSGTLASGTTYYYQNSNGDYVALVSGDVANGLYLKTSDGDGNPVYTAQSIGGQDVTYAYYTKAPRYYTYTVNLTIRYVQGPNVTGALTVANCALPGEMIKIGKGSINITADKSMGQSATYYRIGPREKDSENGKWHFKKDSNNQEIYFTYDVSSPYDAESQTNTTSEILSGVIYDASDTQNPYLLVPAYYFMNGYGVQYCFKVNGIDDVVFPVEMEDANKIEVHNYHRMQPRLSGGGTYDADLHIDLAAQRAKEEGGDFAEPRIYIEDAVDLKKFGEFLNEKSSADEVLTGGKYDFGANMQFFIQDDITVSNYTPADDFKGVLHGDGHIISGLSNRGVLFTKNSGDVYNLGLATGNISTTNEGAYHCCFEYHPSSGNHTVYRFDGTPYTQYSDDDWRYGKVAYDLNQFYLNKRYLQGCGESESSEEAPAYITYVEDYYRNGDYLYAGYSMKNHFEGSEYLRTSNVPTYKYAETAHNMAHPIDESRAKGYVPATDDAPESFSGEYLPLFDAAKISEAATCDVVKNDYIFFGQILDVATKVSDAAKANITMPDVINVNQASSSVHPVADMNNRVYRAGGYYHSQNNNGFYYNKNAYVHDNGITAIDFYGYEDPVTKDEHPQKSYDGYSINSNFGGSVGSASGNDITYYVPICDNGLTGFAIDEAVTRNLLIYAPVTSDANINNLFSPYRYDEETQETDIHAHVIDGVAPDVNSAVAPETYLLHLVERSLEEQPNNDFNAPVEFAVKQKAWYTRVPAYYAESSNSAWEGLCLPFSVNRVEASYNGEITHFYGADDATQGANETNTTNTGHEYWLRGFKSFTAASGSQTAKAAFKRPGIFTVEKKDITCTYTYNNSHFSDVYGDVYGTGDIYASERVYNGYYIQSADVPYIVSFPGSTYKEFDLSGGFNAALMSLNHEAWDASTDDHGYSNLNVNPQTVTFSWLCTNDNVANSTAKGTTIIAVSDKALVRSTESEYGYSHRGTYSALDDVSYGMNYTGTGFERAYKDVLPFRTYMSEPSVSNAKAQTILIFEETGIEELPQEEDSTIPGLRIYSKDRKIIVESPSALTLNLHTTSGQLVRVFDVLPGTNTYSGFANGIYIIGKKKLYIK